MPILKKKKPEKKGMPKRVHLSQAQIQAKIEVLATRIDSLTGVENRNKRLRAYREVALLEKALKNPETMIRDPEPIKEKREKDNRRRVAKKLLKKKEEEAAKRAEHNKLRRIQCLYCHHCEFTRRAHNGGLQVREEGRSRDEHLLQVRLEGAHPGRLPRPGPDPGVPVFQVLHLQAGRSREVISC